MIERIKDRQNQGIAGGGMILGAGAGYINASRKIKKFQNSTEIALKELETETQTKISNINNNILNDCRKNPEYALKIDTFEKEGKIFGKDFHLEDILDEVEKNAYKSAKEEFLQKLETKKETVLKTARNESKRLSRNYIIIGLLEGLCAGIGAIYVKDKLKAKKNADNKN